MILVPSNQQLGYVMKSCRSFSNIGMQENLLTFFTSNFNFEDLELHFLKGSMEMTKPGSQTRHGTHPLFGWGDSFRRVSEPSMTETIKLMKSHTSVRRFKEQALPQEDLTEILTAAQMASSWKNFQSYSVIVVRSQEKKDALYELVPQEAIRQSAVSFSLSEIWIEQKRGHEFILIHSNPKV